MLVIPEALRPEISSPVGLALMMMELVLERFPTDGTGPFTWLATVAIDASKAVNL